MRRLHVTIVFALLLAVTSASFAQQSPSEAPDPQLDRKVTLTMKKTRLPDILAEVKRQTGVNIAVDTSKRFWAVRQSKMTLFVKDMPLKEFIAQCERLLDYHVSRFGKPGKYNYVVWQDMKGRLIEQGIIDSDRAKLAEKKRRAVYDTLSACAQALTMTDEDIKSAKQTDPWLANLASDPQMRQYATLISTIPQEQFDGLVRDDSLFIPRDTLTNEGKTIIDSILSNDKGWPKGTFDNPSSFNLSVSIDATPQGSYELHIAAYPKEPGKYGMGVGGFEMVSSDSESRLRPQAEAKLVADGMTEGTAYRNVSQAIIEGEHNGQSAEDVLNVLLGKRIAKRPSADLADPKLNKTIELKAKHGDDEQDNLTPVLEALASTTGLNIMYEYFNKELSPSAVGDKGRLRDLLNDLCHNDGLQWTKDGKTIRFRCANWASMRSWIIRDDLISKWRACIEKNDGLVFDDLADVCSKLTDGQIEHNFDMNHPELSLLDNPKLSRLFSLSGTNMGELMRSELEFCASLSPDQKKMLWSKGGLPLELVPVENWPKLNGAVTLWEQNVPIYDATFTASLGTESNPTAPNVDFLMKAKVWLKDLPPDIRERQISVIKQDSPQLLADANNKPIETSFGNGFGLSYHSPAVHKLLDEIKQDEKKQAQGKAH